MSRKKNIALLSVVSNTLLVAIKLAVGLLSGSVSIVSEAIHSMMDLVAAVVALVSVRLAETPPDEGHPYGHEKFENVSGVVEGLLIMLAALWIIVEAVLKFGQPHAVENLGLGVAVMLGSALVNAWVSRQLYRVAREEQSIALEADALHLRTDVYTSLGVAAGLAAMWLSGIAILDAIVAIGVALFILREAFALISRAFGPLIDSRLPEADVEAIRRALARHSTEILDYHDLRTRQSGRTRHIDMHITLHRNCTLGAAHALCDRIEREIESEVSHAQVLIHAEPCDEHCQCPQPAA
jgi:cation diffusion facilitator family transporter